MVFIYIFFIQILIEHFVYKKSDLGLHCLHMTHKKDARLLCVKLFRRMAENGFAPPPLGNFADISYLVEN